MIAFISLLLLKAAVKIAPLLIAVLVLFSLLSVSQFNNVKLCL